MAQTRAGDDGGSWLGKQEVVGQYCGRLSVPCTSVESASRGSGSRNTLDRPGIISAEQHHNAANDLC